MSFHAIALIIAVLAMAYAIYKEESKS